MDRGRRAAVRPCGFTVRRGCGMSPGPTIGCPRGNARRRRRTSGRRRRGTVTPIVAVGLMVRATAGSCPRGRCARPRRRGADTPATRRRRERLAESPGDRRPARHHGVPGKDFCPAEHRLMAAGRMPDCRDRRAARRGIDLKAPTVKERARRDTPAAARSDIGASRRATGLQARCSAEQRADSERVKPPMWRLPRRRVNAIANETPPSGRLLRVPRVRARARHGPAAGLPRDSRGRHGRPQRHDCETPLRHRWRHRPRRPDDD